MIEKIKTFVIGSPLPTYAQGDCKLDKIRALGALSPDALSSIAYANQEIYVGLLIAGSAGLGLALPIAIAISALLAIVALSYYQTIQAYPSGGGSYIVASENLGKLAGLTAGAALLIDYILTAAVSLTAGVAAVTSAYPELFKYRIELALGLLVLITIINLRGVNETGLVMSIPVYFFLFTFLSMLIYGGIKLLTEGSVELTHVAPLATQPLSLFLVLHAFSAGCTAMTGVEAISNGVPIFKPPESKNAGKTMIVMAFLMAILLLGSIGLTQSFAIIANPYETILSALTRSLFGSGFLYVVVQTSTLLILAVAANTSFADFPRIAAIMAKDGYMPRQFTNIGDRLVYQNGIILLSLITGVLIVLFNGDTHLLIPLFAVGVFMAFTLSQAGMVVHWFRQNKKINKGWWWKSLLNGLGAAATGLTLLIVGISKFFDGAWIILLLIPLIVFALLKIKAHYILVGQQLSIRGIQPIRERVTTTRAVIFVGNLNRGMVDAVNFARSSFNQVIALYVELEPGSAEKIRQQWLEWWPDVKFEVRSSPYRSIIGPLLSFLDEVDQQAEDGQLSAVVLPEIVPSKWWHELLHNQTASLIKFVLLHRRRTKGFQRLIIDVPYHLEK